METRIARWVVVAACLVAATWLIAGERSTYRLLETIHESVRFAPGRDSPLQVDVKEKTVTTHTTTFTCCGLTHTTNTTGTTEEHAKALRKDIETFCDCEGQAALLERVKQK